jgi:mycoredoxin-dependent peroxiredoxin
MKKLMFALVLACIVLSQPLSIAAKVESATMPKVGDLAPDFKMQYVDAQGEKEVTLSQYRGKQQVVLAFYVFAFTGGWTQQMKNFQQNLKKLEATDTQVLGVSMDSPYANKAFADSIGVTFPLLSDWGGETTRKYGIYVDKYKAARRVNFLIGKDGRILEEQVDSAAIDPSKIVDACERPKLKQWSAAGSVIAGCIIAECGQTFSLTQVWPGMNRLLSSKRGVEQSGSSLGS